MLETKAQEANVQSPIPVIEIKDPNAWKIIRANVDREVLDQMYVMLSNEKFCFRIKKRMNEIMKEKFIRKHSLTRTEAGNDHIFLTDLNLGKLCRSKRTGRLVLANMQDINFAMQRRKVIRHGC